MRQFLIFALIPHNFFVRLFLAIKINNNSIEIKFLGIIVII